jgi:sugar phosphate isomerase/epimerase
MTTRRQFLKEGATLATGIALAGSTAMRANPMGQPLGFQTFEIIKDLTEDWQGTWNKMASYGYKYADLVQFSVFAPKMPPKSNQEILDALKAANLDATNGHFGYKSWMTDYDNTVKSAHELKLKSVICTLGPEHKASDDYKKMADDLNMLGNKLKAEGLLLGYHNHAEEFVALPDRQIPWDVLIQNTDPKLVSYQIDVGNLTFGGGDAVTYLNKYPGRYYSLHVKDYVKGVASVPVGQGTLPWPQIFAIAKKQNIKSYVAEVGAYGLRSLEGAPLEPAKLSMLESFKQSADFLKTVK